MRAVVCRSHGTPDTLKIEDWPTQTLREGQVRVAIAAAGLNFADTLAIAGKYQDRAELPFIPGFEAAGIVSEVGPGVRDVKKGDRVIALPRNGAFAEEAVCYASEVFPVPDGMSLVTAASLPVAYGTSEVALNQRARLKSGETVLVLGAAGGVGLTSVAIAKIMGARVIAAARGAGKLALAREHGADETIDYDSENLRDRVKALTGDAGVNVVIDPVGGDAFDAALRVTAWEGRIVTIGFASGKIPQIPANLLLVKNIGVLGVYWGAYRKFGAPILAQSLQRIFAWCSQGRLKPHVSHQIPLADVATAMTLMLTRQSTGKVVLVVNPSLQ